MQTFSIKISDEVRAHLSTHFQKDLPGSKFYAESPEDLLNMAQQLFPEIFSSAKPEESTLCQNRQGDSNSRVPDYPI